MNRRDTLSAIAALGAVCPNVRAQPGNKIPVIGTLNPGSAGAIAGSGSAYEALQAGLSSLGYVDGKTLRIEARWAQGKPEQLLAAQRVPAISPFRDFADNGGLLSYGVNLPVMYRSLAPYIAKILRGAKPGELPIEQPTHFELFVNLKAARAMGIKIPPAMLARADEVIE